MNPYMTTLTPSGAQGEVESIAQMKPKGATEHDDGLLEYLEDIIGTSQSVLSLHRSDPYTDAGRPGTSQRSRRRPSRSSA